MIAQQTYNTRSNLAAIERINLLSHSEIEQQTYNMPSIDRSFCPNGAKQEL